MINQIKQALTRIKRHIDRTLLLFIFAGSLYLALLYHLAIYLFFGRIPQQEEFVIAAIMVPGNVILYIILRFLILRPISSEFGSINRELYFIDLFKNHTSEFVIILNEFGQIESHNNAFTRTLHLENESIIGKPLREIFSLSELDRNLHYRQLILEKLKEAFQGRETELISTVLIKAKQDIQTIHLKLNPIMQQGELQHIFVTGRLLQTDYITNRWLNRENSSYSASNDLSLVHLFSYRLTRNLDGKLPREDILYIQIALQEVLINAIEHGNLEIDFARKTELKQQGGNYWELLTEVCNEDHLNTRKVRVEYELTPAKVSYSIEDEGRGFDWQQYMNDNIEEKGSTLIHTFHGVGLQMIKKSFNRITFNEKGNRVILEKDLPGEETK